MFRGNALKNPSGNVWIRKVVLTNEEDVMGMETVQICRTKINSSVPMVFCVLSPSIYYNTSFFLLNNILQNHKESFKFEVDCLEWQFQCADRKRCIDKRRRCDGYNDCLDKSDELQCKGM